jgi:hypothetical protein
VLVRLGVARLGIIELMFLLAPLVIMPLSMELRRVHGEARAGARATDLAQVLQPVGAVLVVVSMWLPPGRRAGLLALGWMVVCGFAAMGGAIELLRDFRTRTVRISSIAAAVSQIDLAVGGAWLVASRLGMRPMGIREPIGLLTAVHFHFAGFATAAIASSTLQFAERRSESRWLRGVVVLVTFMPFVVAAGFVISPLLKMAAAVVFSCSVAVLGWLLWKCADQVEDGTARRFLRGAAASVLAGVALSATYAVTDFIGSDRLTIPRMASTHGVINATGFCLLGLLGWLVEWHGRRYAADNSPILGTEEIKEPEEALHVR